MVRGWGKWQTWEGLELHIKRANPLKIWVQVFQSASHFKGGRSVDPSIAVTKSFH